MKKKLIYFLFLMLPFLGQSQEYIDLLMVNYGKTQKAYFENQSENTTISTIVTNITLPIPINKKNVAITGVNYESKSLQLFPNSDYKQLYTTTLKAGLQIIHSERWSGVYVLLPKIASDYINITGDDFYMGGATFWKYKKNKKFSYTFGLYTSKEAYGQSIVPLFGIYYLSPNSRFEINSFLPNDANINYALTEKLKLGVDYLGHGNSFKLTTNNVRSTYAENNTVEFSSFIQHPIFNKNLLFRLKVGYSLNQYDVYPIDQKLDVQILLLKFGPKRTLLNTDLSSTVFFKIETIYRFDLNSVKNK